MSKGVCVCVCVCFRVCVYVCVTQHLTQTHAKKHAQQINTRENQTRTHTHSTQMMMNDEKRIIKEAVRYDIHAINRYQQVSPSFFQFRSQ